jgi:putative transcriptional regulator
VEPQRGFVLHNFSGSMDGQQVVSGLYLSMTMDSLSQLLSEPSADMRFCLGYAGWGPNQLEQEISAGAWLFTEANDSFLAGDPEKLWDETVRGMGVDPAMLLPGGGIH